MKSVAKRIVILVMSLVIVISSMNVPQQVQADNFYTISLNANGGYFSKTQSGVTTIRMPSVIGLTVSSYYSPDERENYQFLGWSTSKMATTATYAVGAVLPKKSATYYAVWRNLATIGIKLDQTDVVIKMGTTQQLTATVLPTYASNKKVSWTSSNSNILKITQDGTITPIRPGTVTVTATTDSGNYRANTTVKVIHGVDVSVDITENCDTKQTIEYSVKSTGTTGGDKIVGYYFDGEYQAITPTHATIIAKKVDTAKIYTFAAVAANGARNYTSAMPFHNVTFHSNDGSGREKTYLFHHAASPLIKDTKELFEREGYCLAGWSKTPYANEPEPVFVDGANEYYAVWYKVNISDETDIISKESIFVKRNYEPTPIYITVTAPNGGIVDYDTEWSIKKAGNGLFSYELKNGNLLYTTIYSGNSVTIKSSDGILEGTVKVDLYENITVTKENLINSDGSCTAVYYVHLKESSLKCFTLDGVQHSVSDIAGYDENTNTYRIESVHTQNGVTTFKMEGEDGSYIFGSHMINVIEENYGIIKESTLLDKNGVPAATAILKCGKIEDACKGYYFGTSENYLENTFYSLSENNNDVNISEGCYTVQHSIRKSGTYYYTPLGTDDKVQNTYQVTVCEVSLNAGNGYLTGENQYYVFQEQWLNFKKFPVPQNFKENQIFRGWYATDGTYTRKQIVNNMTLTAKWRTNPFKDENGNDTGYVFTFQQFKFGFSNFGCEKNSRGHCKGIAKLACRFVTMENDFNVSDFQKVEADGSLITVNNISDFTNITGADTDTVYRNVKTGKTLKDYICGYQHGGTGVDKLDASYYSNIKDVLEVVKDIKNTGVPVEVGINGIVESGSDVVPMGHALVAYNVKRVKSTSDYAEYALSIYDSNDLSKERELLIWCIGGENNPDAEWGWEYEWNATTTIGSDYEQSRLSATVYDCNN